MSKVEDLANQLGQMDKRTAAMLAGAFAKALGIRVYQAPLPPKQPEVPQMVQTEFTVKLVGFASDKKIALIREIRAITGLGLVESKQFVENCLLSEQTVREDLTKHAAQELQQRLQASGAVVKLI